MLVEDTGFVGPVPVAVTTVRLVREAAIQLRRPCLPRLRAVPFLGLAVVHRPGALGAAW